MNKRCILNSHKGHLYGKYNLRYTIHTHYEADYDIKNTILR